MEKRICRKCGESVSEDIFHQNIQGYIEYLDEHVKADAGLYKKRLSCCESCNHLSSGICRLCGCFVELRAAIAVKGCPAAEHYW